MVIYNSYGKVKYLLIVVLTNVTGPAKIDHVSTKNHRFLACLLYHNFITVYTTATKSSSLLQNLMGFLQQLTEISGIVHSERKILVKI